MSVSSIITVTLMAITSVEAAFATHSSAFQFLPGQPLHRHGQIILPSSSSSSSCQSIEATKFSSSCLLATRERTTNRNSQTAGRGRSGRGGRGGSSRKRDDNDRTDNAFGDDEDGYDYGGGGYDDFDDDFEQPYVAPQKQRSQQQRQQQQSSQSNNRNNNNTGGSSSSSSSTAVQQHSTFYSQKTLADPSFSTTTSNNGDSSKQFFQQLCQAAKITRPSRIQSLAWPPLLRGENTVVADQTGSGKTLGYLLPLLQKLHALDQLPESATQNKKKRTGAPRVVILTPTAELADQIHSVCTSLSKSLSTGTSSWSFNPFVTTATGSHSTNIRDQIRFLQSTPVDVLISTPGRLSTILRTKKSGLDLSHVKSLVLDEVDFLMVDETFGPQLRTVGVAVNSGSEDDNGDDGGGGGAAQFVFVTATLPEDVLDSIKTEFPAITELRGPGLHRIQQNVHQTLIDVSVSSTLNRDKDACFDIKVKEMLKGLRGRRCNKTLIFCNTVETCRSVENVLRRKDRRGRRSKVWAYHNALGADVRMKNLRSFSSGGDGEDAGAECILVCTDRAARGIDFDSNPVDHVLLFDFPKDPAEYVRRVGRTARAGRSGASTVLAYGWQLPIARKIMGISGANDGKKGNKKGNAKLEGFNMMKSSDGWYDSEEEKKKVKEDEYYIKGGARKRKERAMERKQGGPVGGGATKKKKKKQKK